MDISDIDSKSHLNRKIISHTTEISTQNVIYYNSEEMKVNKDFSIDSCDHVSKINDILTKEESEDRINLLLIMACSILSTFLVPLIIIILYRLPTDPFLIFPTLPYVPQFSGKIIQSCIAAIIYSNSQKHESTFHHTYVLIFFLRGSV